MSNSNSKIVPILAGIGATSLLAAGWSLSKLLIALRNNSNFSAVFLRAPPKDAYANRVFWITGASSGVGRALALHLCSSHNDVKLILSSRRQSALEEVADECRKIGNGVEVKVLTVDLSDLDSLASKAQEALSLYGRINVLVNNGGISTRSMARDAGLDVDKMVTNVDFLSYVALAKALVPSWENQSKDEYVKPTIINTSSVCGKVGLPTRTIYCAAKFAIHGFFDSFRFEQEIVGHPVNVLNVVLGPTRTNVSRNAVTENANSTFGETDKNIESGQDPAVVVERVVASSYAGMKELWMAPTKDVWMLYLNQYIPETSSKMMAKKLAKQYGNIEDNKK